MARARGLPGGEALVVVTGPATVERASPVTDALLARRFGHSFSASLARALMSLATTSSSADSTTASARSSARRISRTAGSETMATMPEWPGVMAFSS